MLPLRVDVQGSALEWVHTRLCQFEQYHILSRLGRRAAARTSRSSISTHVQSRHVPLQRASTGAPSPHATLQHTSRTCSVCGRTVVNSRVENSLLCGVCVVCACIRVLCVRDMYIQRYRNVPEHTHI